MDTTTQGLREALLHQLADDERLVWDGVPQPDACSSFLVRLVARYLNGANPSYCIYAVTNRRIIVLRFTSSNLMLINSLDLGAVRVMGRIEYPQGVGTLRFETGTLMGIFPYGANPLFTFWLIRDAKTVESQVLRLSESLRISQSPV